MSRIDKNPAKVQIDKRDTEILKILEEDGRIPFLALARRMKLSHETVRYRINKLIKLGVIQKFSVSVDKKKLGYEIYAVILLITGNYTQEEWDELFDYLMEHPNIVSVEKITGDHDLKFAFWAKNPEDFDAISHTIKTKFSKIIKGWTSYIFTNHFKRKELPF